MTFDLGITRRQRYVSNQTAANVTTSTYAQGGTITSYTYSGTTYIAHIFTASGIFTVTSVIYPLEFLAVAGGGGGANNNGTNAGGGGGGGGIVTNGNLNVINRVYASSDYRAVTTATIANAKGGWVYTAQNPLTDFTGGNGTFYFSWSAVQQTGGGARTSVIPEVGADNVFIPQQYYMEIGITGIGPTDLAVGLIRDGYPKDGYANMPYVNLNGGNVTAWQAAGGTALGTFAAGDTLQLAWDSSYQDGRGTYWWVGKNNTWYSTPFVDYTNVALTTSTYKANGLRVIFMCAASGGTNLRGQFRSGVENRYATPSNGNAAGIPSTTITNYTGFYTYPLGMNYASTGATYLVTVGAGGGVGAYNPSAQVGSPGSNGGDTVIYNGTNPSYYYSTYFSNSYITATNAAFSFGTGDFTIETWLYPTSSYGKQTTTYSYRPIFNSRNFVAPDVTDRGFLLYLDYQNKVTIYTSGTTYINTVNTVTNAAWSHLAVARTNGVFNVWINGVKDRITFLTTASTTYSNFTNTNIMIGYGSQNIDLTQANFFTGYFSNYRIVRGLSVYNPGVRGLTAPLTATQSANVNGTPSVAISGTSTSLLMRTTSTTGIFYDSSLGTTSTLTTSTTTSYSSGLGPGTYSGSLSFNGTNQYLSSATSTAFVFGTSDFTVEYWVYYNALTAGTTYCIIGSGRSANGYFFGSVGLIPYMSTSVAGYQVTPGATFKLQQWTHVAWVRNTAVAPGVNFYMNGSWAGYVGPGTSDNITEVGFSIGARSDPAFYSNAYVSNIRVVKGLAVYTNRGTFTPPTTITSATQSTSTNLVINAVTTQTVLLTFNSATIVNLSTLTITLNQTSGTVSVSTFAPFTTSTEVIRAFGGGGGGAPYTNNGQAGGSGGGAPGSGYGGAAIPGQGNRGGQGSVSLGCGGGGFSYPGGPALNDGTWPTAGNPAGAGGAGGYFNHSGAMVAYSGGGGGGSWNGASWTVGPGGVGGGGNGAYYNAASVLIGAVAGTTNSGGGGGGSNLGFSNAAAGGSGIVIFRYPAFLGDAARFPTDLTDSNLKNTTLLLSSNRSPTASTPVYGTTVTSSAFVIDYLIVGGGGGGGGAVSTGTGTGGGGGGAGGVVSVVGYTPPATFNSLFYADVTYGPASLGGSAQGWTTATDFGSLGTGVWGFSYTGLQPSTGAKTSALVESGPYYFEIQITYNAGTINSNALLIGLVRNSIAGYVALNNVAIYMADGNTYIGDGVSNNTSQADTRGAFAVGDVLGIAYNPTTNRQWFSKNGQWLVNNDPAINAGYPITGTGPIVLQFVSGTSSNVNMGGTFRKSSANSYAAPTGFVPYTYAIILSSSTWTITVGSGGLGGTSSATPTSGSSGQNSSIGFSNTNFIAYGGGGGGASYPTSAAGLAGGSGGGGSYNTGGGVISVGQGNVGAPTSAAFSAAGATTSTGYPGGGGGGAGGAGSWTFHSATGGSGGVGTYTSILSTATALTAGVGEVVGTLVYFAGGGSGAGINLGSSSLGSSGSNSGGGGSGAIYGSTQTAGTGSSGVVIIRYPNAQPDATITPGVATYINIGGYKTYIFTATGTITFANSSTYSTTNYVTGYVSGTAIINNRTIVDASLNNIIINTATTTISQGSFSPYGSQWSTSFNGSTDYTSFVSTVTTGTAFQQNVFWGANKSFTIEAWLNPNTNQLSNTATVILGDVQPIGLGIAWSVGLDSSNKPMMYWKDPVNGNNFLTATNTLSTGTWNHVAWVANAGTPTIFINGANQFLTTSTISTLTNTTQTFGIVSGAYFNKFYNGSISNLRVSTSPLYFPNLSLASSGYFNGSSYLTSATSTAMTFGTNNFTVEFWVYWLGGLAGYNQIVGSAITANGVAFGAGSGLWYMTTQATGYSTGIAITLNQWYHVAWVRNSGVVSLYLNGVLSYSVAFTTNITDIGFTLGGTAAAQNSNVYVSNLRVLNGTALYNSNFTVPTSNLTNITNTTLLTFLTTSTTFTNYASPPSTLAIGGGTPSFVGVTPFTVSSFSPPTSPLNAPANTILLTNNTYAFIDNSTSSFAISTGTTTSVPKIQKYSPFSIGYAYDPLIIGGSISLNGYSDYLYTTTATDINFLGTATSLQFDSDFTIECWIYTTSTAVVQTIFDTAGKDGNALRPNAFSLNRSTAGLLYFNYNNSTSTFSAVAVKPFNWVHVAVTRYSGVMQIWQNGIQTLAVNTTTSYSTGQLVIGRSGTTSTAYFSGFISDFRIINGQAIYTNTFNPPVAPLKPLDLTTSTSLLLNFSSAAIVDATMNHNVIVVNTATISSSVTKYNSRSISMPGVVDYLTVIPISTSSYALGTGDFTVEMWVYLLPQPGFGLLQPATVRSVFDMRTQNTANAGFDIHLGNTGTLNVTTLGSTYITGTTFISVNSWNHIALVKQGTSHNLFLNGIPEGNTFTGTATNFINPTVRIGFGAAGTGYLYGYIDDLRITRGVARYSYPGFLVPQKSLPVK